MPDPTEVSAIGADEATWHRLVAEACPQGIFLHERGRILRATASLARMFGYEPGEMVGLDGRELAAPEDRERLMAHIASETEAPLEGYARHRSGRIFPARVTGRTIEVDGRPLRLVLFEDLTERRRAEAELRLREARYRALVEHLPAVVWTTDRELRYTALEGSTIVGDRRLGQTVGERFRDTNDPTAAVEAHRRALAGESVGYRIRNAGRVYEAHVEPLRDPQGRVIGVIGVGVDVTAKALAEEQARESAERLHQLAEHLRAVLWVAEPDPEPHLAYASPAFAELWGFAPQEAIDAPERWLAAIHPADREGLRAHIRAQLASGSYEAEYRIVRPGGEVRWIADRGYAVRDAAGRVARVTGISVDVTAYKEIEAALREREQELRSLADNVPEVIARFDRAHQVSFVNAAVTPIAGRPPAWFLGRRIDDFPCAPALRRHFEAKLAEAFQRGAPDALVWELPAAGGGTRTYHTRVVPEREGDGITHVLTTTRDITERLRAEEAARTTEARFRALVEHASDLVAIVAEDGTLTYASPSHERVLGVAPERIVGQRCQRLVHRDYAGALEAHLARAMREPGPTPPELLRFRDARSEWRTLSCILTDMRHDPAVGGIVANSRDVTEQVRLEEQLRHAHKMEALGQLAGGVAHDFNNILAAISGYAQLLRAGMPDDDERARDVDEILNAAQRGSGVTRQLLAFSRRQTMETEVLDLTAVVRDMGRMLRPLLPAAIELSLPDAETPAAPVRASRAQLEQIVLNLVVNARDAMPRGGRLTLAVAPRHRGHRREATLTVADTGVGIPPAVRPHIFEPFFTTKPLGEGTGLGLATVYGLVRQFDGAIGFESETGRGTAFTLAFPLVAPREAAGAPPPAATGAGVRAGRVLLVEDEPQVRAVARRILSRAGFTVVEASNGAEALERLRETDGVDVVLTDAAMPVLGGRELAAAVATSHPGLPVVLMSGYAELSGPPGAEENTAEEIPGVTAFIEKPFTVERLVEVVSKAMGGG